MQSNEKVDQGTDEVREAVYENTEKHGVTLSGPSVIAYENNAYVSVEQTAALTQQNQIIPIGDLRDKLYEQQNHSANANVRLSAEETSLDEGYQEESPRLSRCSEEITPSHYVNC